MSSKKSKQPAQVIPVEAPNSLISNSRIKFLDLIGEGEIEGFVVKSGAYGNDPLVSTYFDEIPVRNLDGSYNINASGQGFNFAYTYGTTGQAPIAGFEKVENIIPLTSNTRVALMPAGAGTSKDLITSFNTTTYPDADSVKVTVRVPALLTQDNNGNTNGFEIKYAVDISFNNQAFVQQEEVTIRGKCTAPYLKTTTYVLPKGTTPSNFYSWKIRIRRTTTNIVSIKTQNELFVDSIAVVSSSSFSYPNTALVGIELSADQFSSIPTRSYEMKGVKVRIPNGYTPTTYNVNGTITAAVYPGIWAGDYTTATWTDNPVWILNDIITNKRYGLGDYIREDWVDKWSLYEISQYCDELVNDGEGGLEPRFTCNAVIQNREDAYQLLLNLVSIFRGMLYWSNGRLFANMTDNKSPLYNFTNANVINGKFSYSDTARNTRSTVAVVKWIDPNNNYRESVEYIEDAEGIARYGYIEKEITAFACTSKGQAYRIGNWSLQTERLLTETVTFQSSYEGLYIKPGDVFNVYDNFRNNKSQGGRIVGFNPTRTTINLDRPINLETGVTYAFSAIVPVYNLYASGDVTDSSEIPLIRRSQIETRLVTTNVSTGITSLNVNAAFSTGIFKGSVWLLSATGTSGTLFQKASPYRCLATSEVELGKVEILGVEYNTGINNSIETEYTVVANPINTGDNSPISAPSGLRILPITGLYANNDFYFYLQLYWSGVSSTNFAYYRASGKKFGGNWELLGNPQNTGIAFNTTVTGFHEAKVASVSIGGRTSAYITGGYEVPGTNPFGVTPPLSGLEISVNYDPNYTGIYQPTPLTGYTGYLTSHPTLKWTYKQDNTFQDLPQYQFVSGFRIDFLDPNTNISLIPNPFIISDPNLTELEINEAVFTGMAFKSGIQRLFKIYIETLDSYGTVTSGASLTINNPPPARPPYASFYPARGGLSYLVNPSGIDTDISEIFIWHKPTGVYTATSGNLDFRSSNLAGFSPHQMTGQYTIYYSLVDTFGFTGCQIFGPITGYTTLGVTGLAIKTGTPVDDLIRFYPTGVGIDLYQSGRIFYISGDENIMFLTGDQTVIGTKNFTGIVRISAIGSGLLETDVTGRVSASHLKALDFLTKTGNLSDVENVSRARSNVNRGRIFLLDAATINTDCSSGNVFEVTLGGNRALAAPTNIGTGATYIWIFNQDAVGNRVLTFDNRFWFADGSSKILSVETGAKDAYTCVSDGTNFYGVLTKKFAPFS